MICICTAEKKSKIFVDSSAWVALFFENDQSHKKAVTLFQKLKALRAPLYTSDYVIDETITTLLFKSGHKQSVAAGKALFFSEIIKIVYVHPDYFKPAWELYQKYADKKFSFTDVTSFVIAKDIHIKKVFSFDGDFSKAGFELIS